MTETNVSQLLEKIRVKYSTCGERILTNGTILVCSAPEIAPQAWLHQFYPPMEPEQLIFVEDHLGQALPSEIKDFYQQNNGIGLFGYKIEIWGKRRSYKRTGDDMWQPFDIVSHNAKNEIPANSPENVVFFGSAERGDSWVYFYTNSRIVGKTPRFQFHELRTWSNFNLWLIDEIRAQDSEL